MNRHFVLLFFALLSFHAFSQSIKGKVQEHSGKPLPFVNVLLLNSNDSTLVKGAVSDTSGVYTINNIAFGTYLLSASMIGYKQAYLPLIKITSQNPEPEVTAFTLSEDITQLGEVVITEKRPFVEQHMDRMVVNVANSIIASGSTALEVLEKAPGVTVDRQNGMLQLRGKEGVIVQLDGKQTYLPMADLVTLLRTMPSDNIDQIELITNPSAKYDAAGNSGIINIRLKKNNNVGTNVSMSIGVGSGRYERGRGSVQLNRRTEKLNFFGNYGTNRGGNYFDLRTEQIIDRGEEHNLADQETYIRFRDRGQNAKAGLDYFINKRTTLGVLWTGFWSNFGEEGTAESSFRTEEGGIVYLHALTDKTISSISSNQIGNVNLQHSFGEKGGQLSADFDLGHFTRNYSNSLLTETVSSDIPSPISMGLLTQMPTNITIRTVKVDYNRSLSPKWKMEAGLKSSYVYSDNKLTLSRGEADNLEQDLDLSNHFQYTEQVNAAYASFSGKLDDKTEMQFGVRSEHTHSVGESLSFNNIVTRDYLNFFPSLFLSRPLSKNHSLSFSYSYRIDRPNYQSLNPARSYVDPYLYSRGNEYLRPQYTHSFELKHGFKDKLFVALGAGYVHGLVFFVLQPVDSIRTERTPLNIGKSMSYNLTLSFPITVMKGWNLQTNFLGVYSQFKYNFQDTPLTVQQVSGRLNASNTIVLGKGWTAELTGWLSTPAVYALFHSPWLGSLDAGLQKSVTSKFQVKLSAQDVFHTNRSIRKIDVPNFTSKGNLAYDTRVLMLTFTYSFGNQQLKGARQHKIGSEAETQRAN
jgi:hypothetical protein